MDNDKSRSLCAGVRLAAAALLASTAAPALAQAASDGDIAELRAAVAALRAEQAHSQARIAELETALASRAPAGAADGSQPASTTLAQVRPAAAIDSRVAPAPGTSPTAASRLQLSGDVRVRYEANFGDEDVRDRGRGVFRARLRAAYAVNDWLTVGGQIATGDPDDPNSADVSLSSFDDDLQVSLDQAYARMTFGDLVVHGGKIPQPFARTELVWDGDVSPQGVSAAYKMPLGGGATLKATGLYFLIDESVAGPNSDMAGVQVGFESAADAAWRVELAAGYYDYSLRSLAGGDAGDFRSNLLRPDGTYLSDFDLLDGIAAVTYQGFGPRWPVRLVGNYVKNLGAATDPDTGFGIDLLAGRASKRGDWRFGYGYAQAAADAVLAAFSQDNTNIATNYRQHVLGLDFVPVDNLILTATYYRYRPKDAIFAGGNDPHDWLDRVRLNFLVNF